MTRLHRFRSAALFLCSLPVSVACSDGSIEPPAVQQRVALEAFSTCEALEAHVEDNAVALMRSYLRPDYFYGGPLRGGIEVGAPTADANSSQGPSAYTKTNVQVQGVDEADFMKNTGTHIYTLAGGRLFVAKSWPAADLSVIAELDLEGYPYSMFLDDKRNRIVVLSSVNAPYVIPPDGASADCLAYGYCSWAVATKVSIIDVTNPAQPSIRDELFLPGWLQNSRRIEGSVRVVLGDHFRWPDNMQWWPDYEEGLWENEALLQARLDRLADDNEEILRARSLSDWLPSALRRLPDGQLISVPYECSDFHRVTASVDLGFTTVATINLDNLGAPPEQTSVIASTSEVYASLESLYLATRHWWWWPRPGQIDHTYLFKFDITDPNQARFVAAGGAPGHILNQFALDEHEGFLRIATTIASREEDPDNEWGRIVTTNRVSVLGERSGSLEVVGQTRDIAEGERITSARFLGTKGFVVTFRQVDPLFTVDLSSPTNPRVVGELKVPGFSSYIHPLDENYLLTIGTHIDEPDPNGQVNWQTRSMKLSIFDVTDFENPVEKFTELVGTSNGYSEAAWEHKAFNYFPERGLLAIPFSDYIQDGSREDYWGQFVSELRVFRVGADTGIAPVGAISMSDIYQEYRYDQWSWRWSPWVRRSVMADDFAYAVSDAGIRVANVANLSQTIATAQFAPVVDYGSGR